MFRLIRELLISAWTTPPAVHVHVCQKCLSISFHHCLFSLSPWAPLTFTLILHLCMISFCCIFFSIWFFTTLIERPSTLQQPWITGAQREVSNKTDTWGTRLFSQMFTGSCEENTYIIHTIYIMYVMHFKDFKDKGFKYTINVHTRTYLHCINIHIYTYCMYILYILHMHTYIHILYTHVCILYMCYNWWIWLENLTDWHIYVNIYVKYTHICL